MVVEVQGAMVVVTEVMEEVGEVEAMATRVGVMEAVATMMATMEAVEEAVAATLVEVSEACKKFPQNVATLQIHPVNFLC